MLKGHLDTPSNTVFIPMWDVSNSVFSQNFKSTALYPKYRGRCFIATLLEGEERTRVKKGVEEIITFTFISEFIKVVSCKCREKFNQIH